MSGKARVIVSIVISALLLGLVVSYCIAGWMPSQPIDWILWVAMVIAGITAIYRISSLTQRLGKRGEEED